jgi:hypothetical protein
MGLDEDRPGQSEHGWAVGKAVAAPSSPSPTSRPNSFPAAIGTHASDLDRKAAGSAQIRETSDLEIPLSTLRV